MVLSQNRCNVLLFVLFKTITTLWALIFIVMGFCFPYIGLLMLAGGVKNLLPGIVALVLGVSAFVAIVNEFLGHKFRIDRYFTGEYYKRED